MYPDQKYEIRTFDLIISIKANIMALGAHSFTAADHQRAIKVVWPKFKVVLMFICSEGDEQTATRPLLCLMKELVTNLVKTWP